MIKCHNTLKSLADTKLIIMRTILCLFHVFLSLLHFDPHANAIYINKMCLEIFRVCALRFCVLIHNKSDQMEDCLRSRKKRGRRRKDEEKHIIYLAVRVTIKSVKCRQSVWVVQERQIRNDWADQGLWNGKFHIISGSGVVKLQK